MFPMGHLNELFWSDVCVPLSLYSYGWCFNHGEWAEFQ